MPKSTTGVLPVEAPEESPDRDEVAEQLAQLGAALAGVAGDRKKRVAVIEKLEGLLASLSPKDYPDLAESPAVVQFLEVIASQKATSSDRPGTIYNRGSLAQMKKPWTARDMSSDKVPWVRFTPTETIDITYNGVHTKFTADVERDYPEMFVGLYHERRRAMKAAEQHVQYLFRQGGVPQDPSIVNEASVGVRAMSTSGRYFPGAGGFDEATNE